MNYIVTILFIVPILAFVLLGLNLLLSPRKSYKDKVSIYECGFNTVPLQTRSEFDIQFTSVALLFLVFDLEILLIYPGAVTLSNIETFGYTIIMIFFAILTIGFIFELGSGVISLSRIYNNKNNNIK